MENENTKVLETTNNKDQKEIKFDLYEPVVSLHEDLEECIQDYDDGMVMIKHPLCNSSHHPDLIEINNKKYLYNKKKVEECEKQEEWVSIIWITERPFRLDCFMKYEDKLTDKDYWETLGDIFTDTEIPYRRQKEWLELFSSKRKGRENLMKDDDWDLYQHLPQKVEVWRGGDEDSMEGLSWTTDIKMGEWFSNRSSLMGNGRKLLSHGYINKEDILMCSHYENLIVCDPDSVFGNTVKEITDLGHERPITIKEMCEESNIGRDKMKQKK